MSEHKFFNDITFDVDAAEYMEVEAKTGTKVWFFNDGRVMLETSDKGVTILQPAPMVISISIEP